MLYIIKKDYFLADYILEAINDRENIRIIEYRRLKPKGVKRIGHLIKRFIRAHIYNKKGLWTDGFFTSQFLTEIKNIRPNDTVLFWGCENLKELLILNREIQNNDKNVFLWNPVATICRNRFSKWEYKHWLGKSGLKVFTFDHADADRYEFNTINQVYRKPEYHTAEPCVIEHNVYYVGVDKQRTALLEKLKKEFDSQGITYNLNIIKDKHTALSPELASCYIDKPIPYKESVDMINRSNCILEILQKGQDGMTLRTLEALFMNKKLMTTNRKIKEYDFYDPANVYIIGGDEQRTVKEFIYTPQVYIQDDITNASDITHWIKKFL